MLVGPSRQAGASGVRARRFQLSVPVKRAERMEQPGVSAGPSPGRSQHKSSPPSPKGSCCGSSMEPSEHPGEAEGGGHSLAPLAALCAPAHVLSQRDNRIIGIKIQADTEDGRGSSRHSKPPQGTRQLLRGPKSCASHRQECAQSSLRAKRSNRISCFRASSPREGSGRDPDPFALTEG